ncbi:MAG TPA: prenyltransferase/squalene oxidase repeat-containing protein [Candidatus Anoxymicrobiaceae bacterium]
MDAVRKSFVAALLAAAVICLASLSPCLAAGTPDALNYIKARQGSDGGFAEPDAASDGTTTCWAMLAGASAGEQVSTWQNAGKSPVDFLQSQAAGLTKLEDIELYTLALSEAGADPRNFAGRNQVSLILAHMKSDGHIGDTMAQHCWGLIALAAAGEAPPAKSDTWLVEQQRADGGWGESDAVVVADTGLAVEALTGIGQLDAGISAQAMKLLKSKIGPAGGFSSGKGTENSMLTASVMRAIYAAGQDPASDSWSFHGNTPVKFMESMQAPDGHYQFSKGTESQPAMTTSTAVPADEGKHFPLVAETQGVDTSSGGVKDLGTQGAGIVPAPESQQKSTTTAGSPVASGSAAAQSTFSGLWLFLIICAVYVAALAIAALIAAKLYQLPGTAGAPPGFLYPQQAPPPTDWPPPGP